MTDVIVDMRVLAMAIQSPLADAADREVEWAKTDTEMQQWLFHCAKAAMGVMLIAPQDAERRRLDS